METAASSPGAAVGQGLGQRHRWTRGLAVVAAVAVVMAATVGWMAIVGAGSTETINSGGSRPPWFLTVCGNYNYGVQVAGHQGTQLGLPGDGVSTSPDGSTRSTMLPLPKGHRLRVWRRWFHPTTYAIVGDNGKTTLLHVLPQMPAISCS